MRLASYNLENLFMRPAVFSGTDPEVASAILTAYQRASESMLHEAYTDADKASIVADLTTLGLAESDESTYAWLRQNHGRLVKRGKTGFTVVAAGSSSWIGWLELKCKTVDEDGTRNTARVITELNTDVIATIEVEGRTALSRFNEDLLTTGGRPGYAHVMSITGNDRRGITVGVMTRDGYPITGIVSHVDDTDATGRVFGRDCAEYTIATPGGPALLVLVAHLKSKASGTPAENNAKRLREASRVARIYEQRRNEGVSHIAVVGDMNDTPDSAPLEPLLAKTDLREVSGHPGFDTGALPGYNGPPLLGTYGGGTRPEKIDYILLSPALYERLAGGGVFRKGVWPTTKQKVWQPYRDMERPEQAASDHAAIWADLTL